jgi:hypothetical protein
VRADSPTSSSSSLPSSWLPSSYHLLPLGIAPHIASYFFFGFLAAFFFAAIDLITSPV